MAGQDGYIRSNESVSAEYTRRTGEWFQLMTVNADTGQMFCWHIRASEFPSLIKAGARLVGDERDRVEKEWQMWWFSYYRK